MPQSTGGPFPCVRILLDLFFVGCVLRPRHSSSSAVKSDLASSGSMVPKTGLASAR